MAPARPRRAGLRKAADSEIHPAEPRVKPQPVRARAASPLKATGTRTVKPRTTGD